MGDSAARTAGETNVPTLLCRPRHRLNKLASLAEYIPIHHRCLRHPHCRNVAAVLVVDVVAVLGNIVAFCICTYPSLSIEDQCFGMRRSLGLAEILMLQMVRCR